MISPRRNFALLALGLCILAVVADASAQIRVDLALRRAPFIRYEPLVAIVTITNMSGGDLELADSGNRKWFSFHIEHPTDEGDAIVPPYNPDYSLSPVTIGAGESIKRGVNVTPLYPLTEYGTYRLRATIYDARSNRYFSSAPLNVEITEGRTLWEQTVGADGGNSTRTITLLSHRLPNDTQLYLRIEDKEAGRVYCTSQLGRLVSFGKPEVQVGGDNDIYILQNVAPRSFLFTHADVNGKILERKQYEGNENTRPTLRRNSAEGFQVVGGIFVDPAALAAQRAAAPPPSVSDRPVPLPKSP